MKIVISPAKTLDYKSIVPTSDFSLPHFGNETAEIETVLRKKTPKKLAELMGISPALAQLNYERNQSRDSENTIQNARQAVFAFKGEVYIGLDAYSLNENQIVELNHKLRILSGLYGLLKPLDLIQPYRLEMGTSLKMGRKANLYKFWDNKITEKLNEELIGDEPLINLASHEYFSVIKPNLLKTKIITPIFKDFVNGQTKVVSFYAKKARGLMVRFIIDKNIENPELLKTFNYENYEFSVNESTDTEWVFIR